MDRIHLLVQSNAGEAGEMTREKGRSPLARFVQDVLFFIHLLFHYFSGDPTKSKMDIFLCTRIITYIGSTDGQPALTTLGTVPESGGTELYQTAQPLRIAEAGGEVDSLRCSLAPVAGTGPTQTATSAGHSCHSDTAPPAIPECLRREKQSSNENRDEDRARKYQPSNGHVAEH